MIYISELLDKHDMQYVLCETGAGIESIEFSISDNLDHLEQAIQDYRFRKEYYGVTELTLHGPFLDLNPMSYDSQIRKTTEYRFAQAYDAGVRLGAKKIIYHTGFIPSVCYLEGWAERMADFWNAFMESRTEMQVLMENLLDPSPEPILKVKNMVKSDNFKLCLDIGHANCYSQTDPVRWAKTFANAIGHVHIHNNYGDRDSHFGLSKGTIPVNEILSSIKQLAPDTTYTIECNTVEDVLSSYHNLEKALR